MAYPKLHVLVNNAGAASVKRELTEDGIEKTFAVNHLAPFLLTNLLLDRLVESAPARIVTVSSVEHFHATLDLDDLSFEKGGYQATKAYARSKLGNILFTKELARRLAGKNATANTLHPGAVATNICGTHQPMRSRYWRSLSPSSSRRGKAPRRAHTSRLHPKSKVSPGSIS